MSPWFIILSVISVELQPFFCNAAVCTTALCHAVSHHFLASMDETIQPCDNFYNFACGRWKTSYPAPSYIRGRWNNLMKLSLLAQTRLRDELQSPPTSSDSEPVKLMKQFYESCIDQRASDRDTVDKIREILRETGGWPLVMGVNQWNENGSTWQSLEEYYSRIQGHSVFYTINPTTDSSSKFYSLTIENSRLWPHMVKDLQTYRALLKKVAEAAMFSSDENVSSEQLFADIDDLVYFENRLYMALMDTVKTPKPAEVVMVAKVFINDFKKKTGIDQQSGIDWEKIFQRIFVITNIKPSIRNPIIIKPLEYFVRLAIILQDTSKRTIVNYIHWKFLSSILPHATAEMEGLFHKVLYNVEDADAKDPRWIYCVNKIGRNYASYSLFIKKYYQENSRQNAENLYREISDKWIKLVQNSNWLSRETKKDIKAKIKSVSATIGYSNFYENDTGIITYFEGLAMSDSYFTNNLNYEYLMWKRRIQLWGQTISSKEILEDPLSLRAHLSLRHNRFVVTPPFLQSPLLDKTLPDYVTFSTVGNVMGHELSHVLDEDVFEKLLTGTETETYKNIVKCFIDSFNFHYNRISSANACHKNPKSKGEFTRRENMADWNGLQFAYKAYQNKGKSFLGTKALELPGFGSYTNDQIFFISFAQSWCSRDDEDYPRDPHAPVHIRVNGVVANTAEFATAFNCKKYTPMHPTAKCNIWTKIKVK